MLAYNTLYRWFLNVLIRISVIISTILIKSRTVPTQHTALLNTAQILILYDPQYTRTECLWQRRTHIMTEGRKSINKYIGSEDGVIHVVEEYHAMYVPRAGRTLPDVAGEHMACGCRAFKQVRRFDRDIAWVTYKVTRFRDIIYMCRRHVLLYRDVTTDPARTSHELQPGDKVTAEQPQTTCGSRADTK